MLAVGDKVRVIDQKPQMDGEIVGVSTWKQVNGGPSEKRCYRVNCDGWLELHWVDASHVEKREPRPAPPVESPRTIVDVFEKFLGPLPELP